MTGTARQQQVGGGLWWNGDTFTLRSVPEEGGSLPVSAAPWRRIPGWLLLPLAPVIGGAFVVALPVVGAVMVAQAIARVAVSGGGQAARDLARTVAAPAPSPGEAHLTGQPPAAGAPGDLPSDEAAPNQGRDGAEGLAGEGLDEAAAEVAARRGR